MHPSCSNFLQSCLCKHMYGLKDLLFSFSSGKKDLFWIFEGRARYLVALYGLLTLLPIMFNFVLPSQVIELY